MTKQNAEAPVRSDRSKWAGGRTTTPAERWSATVEDRREGLLQTAQECLADGDRRTLGLVLNAQHPADLAELIHRLPGSGGVRVFALLAAPLAVDVLAELEGQALQEVAESLEAHELSVMVADMAPDDAADVLGGLPAGQIEAVLELMPDEQAGETQVLLSYAEDTAGGIMTSRFVAVAEGMSVGEVFAVLREERDEDDVSYVYVVEVRRD